MEQDLTYEKALQELRKIVSEIESENVSVDQLAQKVKRASMLIELCQTRLKGTDAEVRKILAQLEGKEEK